jgi:hypothetical protein
VTDEAVVAPAPGRDLRAFASVFFDLTRAPRPDFPLRAGGRGYKADEDWERRIEAELEKSRRQRRRGERVVVVDLLE